jgi:hypothetical protein
MRGQLQLGGDRPRCVARARQQTCWAVPTYSRDAQAEDPAADAEGHGDYEGLWMFGAGVGLVVDALTERDWRRAGVHAA